MLSTQINNRNLAKSTLLEANVEKQHTSYKKKIKAAKDSSHP